MKVALAYGEGVLEVDFPGQNTTVIQPSHRAGLADERAAVLAALESPVDCAPLADWLRPDAKIVVLFTDITRATPNHRLIPWLLGYLESKGARPGQITLLNQLGTHRPNTRAELEKMLTPEVVARYRVINHEPENHEACVALGTTRTGVPAWINRHCVEADVRIITGFIEPHFFAGFSGGPKGIMPGVAHVETVMSNHGAANLSDPRATFGVCEGNPLWEELRDIALRVGPSFLLNVTLNDDRRITGVFAGDLLKAHRAGRDFVRESAMQRVSARPKPLSRRQGNERGCSNPEARRPPRACGGVPGGRSGGKSIRSPASGGVFPRGNPCAARHPGFCARRAMAGADPIVDPRSIPRPRRLVDAAGGASGGASRTLRGHRGPRSRGSGPDRPGRARRGAATRAAHHPVCRLRWIHQHQILTFGPMRSMNVISKLKL
jgi:hypothetical protein